MRRLLGEEIDGEPRPAQLLDAGPPLLGAHEAGQDRLARPLRRRDDRPGHLERVDHDRRDEDDDQAVEARIVLEDLEGRGVARGVGRGDHVDRIPHARLRHQHPAQRRLRLPRQLDDLEAQGRAGVGRHDRRAAGVRQDPDPVPRR